MKSLLKNSIIITAGILLSKALSLLFIFPFSNLVGPIGVSLYTYAFVPFAIFIELCELGIPSGIAKLVSKYNASGMYAQCKKVFRVCFSLMIIFSIIGFLLMNLLAGFYADMVLDGITKGNTRSDVVSVIRILSLSILIVPVASLIRGYFQGHMKNVPSAISQITEQLFRVTTILVATYIIIDKTNDYVLAVKVAVFGTFIGAIASLGILIYFFIRNKSNESGYVKKIDYKEIFKISLPFAFFGISFSMYQFIDSITFNKGLVSYGIENPEVIYGIYNFQVMKLIMIPLAIISGIEVSLLPVLIKSLEKKEMKAVNRSIEFSYTILLYVFVPLTLFIMLFSNNIYNLLYNDIGGPDILFHAVILIPILASNTLLISMMQGTNLEKHLYKTIILGLAFKAISNYFLISSFSYLGSIIATLIGILITTIYNLYLLHKSKYIRYQTIVKRFNRIAIVAVLGILILLAIKVLFPFEQNGFMLNSIYLFINFVIFSLIYYFSLRRMWQSI